MNRKTIVLVALPTAALAIAGALYLTLALASEKTAVASVAPAAVPVVAGVVIRHEVPIYLRGVGTVIGYNTDVVRSQIQGQLIRIAFTEGQAVKAGDLLAEIDPRPYQAQLDQMIANRDRDQAQLANAVANLGRYTELENKGYATPQLSDTQKAQVAQLQSAIKADEALIEQAEVQLSYTKLTSPITGITGVRQIDVGNIIHPTDPNGLVVVTQVEPISLIFTLPQAELPQIQMQMAKGPLSVIAYSQDDKIKLDEGKLLLVNNQIAQATGTVQLKATFPNTAHLLWPGQLVNARLLVDTRQDGLTIAAPAVQQGQSGSYVYVISPDGKAEVRPVTVAQISEGQALIDSGLQANETVVVDGQYRLRQDSPVRVLHGKAARQADLQSAVEKGNPMNFSAPFIRRPIATILLMAGLLLCGLATYPLLPVAALPNVNYPTILVTAQLPGADPQTMASTVATPLEQQMGQIPGVTQLTSTSALGVTSVTVQFELARTVDSAAVDVLAAINAASPYLPTNIPYPPTIRKVNPAETPVLLLALTSDTLPLTTIDAYAENILLPKISQIPGVGLVGIGGQVKPAIRIQVNPQALAARGIGLEDVRSVIAQANVDLPKGTLNSPRQTYTLNTNDQLLKPDAYDALIVAYRNGSPVRIRDIGKAIEGPENDLLAGWYNKQRAVILAIQRVPGANVIATVDRVKALLPQLEASLPPAIEVSIAADRTTTIRASVADVQFTLLLTVALVVMVIFLFLRNLWATVIPAVTVPLSLVGTFAALYALGYSLDNLSLMALSIAVGFVVDDAVVVIENIVRHLEQGLSPMEAAFKGSREIGFTIVSITLSLIAVFIPLFLMGGYVGKLFQEFAVTISVSLVISLIVSLTLTPMMCARLLKDDTHRRHGRLYRLFERGFDNLLALYERGLKVVLRQRFITLMVMLGTIVLTGYLYVVIPKGFFPQQDTGQIVGITEAAQDISFPAMAQRQQALVDILLKDPAIESVSNYIGPGGPTATLNQGRVFIVLKPANQRDASADQVINRLRPQLARIQGIALYMQAAQDITIGARLSKTQYQYTLTDADSTELAHWSAVFVEKMKAIPGITDVASDQANAGPMLNVTVNREVASSFGILPLTIDNVLDDAFGQRIVSTIFTQLNQYHVVLEVDPRFQYSPQALRDIYLNSSSGQQVPLSTLVNSDIQAAPIVVNHQGMFPSVTISFNLQPGTALGDAVAAIQQIEKQTGKPASLATSFQGNAQAFQASLSGTPLLIGAALVVIYIILGVLYESAIHPITILSTLPSAGIGALLLLMAVHMDLSVIAMIGIILLIGIVKKNGIMLVDFALEVERNEGLSPEESIYRACIMRFRPILMTTMAALLGGVPLMLGTGTGSEIRQPLGYAIVGGLLLSQVLTLYTTPVVFLYLDRLTGRSRARRAAQGEAVETLTSSPTS